MSYSQAARWYDAIYGFKDYAAEAEMIRSRVIERRPAARRLLDVACGTGEHLKHLRPHFDVEGLDSAAEMLEIARAKLPGVLLHLGDMRRFDLGHTFDAAICMFGAMGHLDTAEEVAQAVACIARHLEPGGVLIVEPFLTPDRFMSGRPSGRFIDEENLKLARVALGRREGDKAILDMHHLIATPDGVESFVERMVLTLFPLDVFRQAMSAVGMSIDFDPKGPMDRGLFVCTLPASRDDR
jgi:SAM-dependent methyltransferase